MTDQEASLNVLLSATAEVVDAFAHDLRVSREEVLQLRAAMETRAPVEQARGMLMMRYGLSADQALHLLLRWSRSQDVELRALAAAMVSLGINEGHRPGHPRTPTVPGAGRDRDASTLGPSDTTND